MSIDEDWIIEDYDLEPEWVEDDPDLPYGTAVRISGWSGIAWRVISTYDDRVKAHMIGDDRHFDHDRDDVILLPREDFCGECGQIGCGHDGLDRS